MIVLDTNVVSEAFRPDAALSVKMWYASQQVRDLYVCAPVMAELRYGTEKLAQGARRADFMRRYEAIKDQFRSRVLAFNLRAAEAFAEIVVAREQAGAPISPMDAQIAAIARANGASVATRNTKDFEGCGVALVDPWA
jgi:toxin FitB